MATRNPGSDSPPRPDTASAEAQAHLDLGLAYRELGLLRDAIFELLIARGDPVLRERCERLLDGLDRDWRRRAPGLA